MSYDTRAAPWKRRKPTTYAIQPSALPTIWLVAQGVIDAITKKFNMPQRFHITNHRFRIAELETSVPGTYQLELTTPDIPCGLGWLWWRHGGSVNEYEVLQLVVDEQLMRQGIATELVKHLAKRGRGLGTKRLYTGYGTPKFGKPFMLATGWKQVKEGWVYPIRRKAN